MKKAGERAKGNIGCERGKEYGGWTREEWMQQQVEDIGVGYRGGKEKHKRHTLSYHILMVPNIFYTDF